MSNTNSTTNNIELQEELSFDLERLELQFGHRLSQAALFGLIALPLIPGLLTMISVGVHFPTLLGIHWIVAWILGAVAMVGIEVLGLFSIRLALRMRKFNHKAEGRPVEKAPIGQGYMAAAIYLLSVLSLTVLLKISPELAAWSLIPLCLMGALADWIFALNGDHNERETALRKIILDEQRANDQATATAQLLAQLADRDSTITNLQTDVQTLQERVQYAKDLNAEQARQFDTERQQLNTEIVKLTAQLDALRTMNMLQSPVLYTAQSVQAPAVDTTQTVQSTELYTEKDSEPVTFDDGRNKANEQKRVQKAHRQSELLQILFTELNGSPSDQLNKSALADRLNTTRVTIGRDIDELIDANRLSINGHINVL